MKSNCKYLFGSLLFLLITNTSFSQKTTLLTGSLEGASENDMVYAISNRESKDSCPISNKQFKFALHANKEWDVYFINCPNVSFSFPLFIKEGSVICLDYDIKLRSLKISGDENAEEQNS